MAKGCFDFARSRFLSDVHEIDPETELPICGKDYIGVEGEWLTSDDPNDVRLAQTIGYDFSKVTCIDCIREMKRRVAE